MFEAFDTVKKLNVAFKICKDQGKTDRKDREALILQKLFQLKHPNIAKFLDRSAPPGLPLVLNPNEFCRSCVAHPLSCTIWCVGALYDSREGGRQ